MAHCSHPRELEPYVAQEAIRRVRSTGAVIRCQAPIISHVNDDADVWARMWTEQVKLGAVPYYMFVERDTGAKHYFALPLAKALRIFDEAYRQVSGLARTVRGPSMSASPGKVLVDGVTEIGGEKLFVLKLLQGRNPDWVGRPFFAKYDLEASWLDDLAARLWREGVLLRIRVSQASGGANSSTKPLESIDLQNGTAWSVPFCFCAFDSCADLLVGIIVREIPHYLIASYSNN